VLRCASRMVAHAPSSTRLRDVPGRGRAELAIKIYEISKLRKAPLQIFENSLKKTK